MNNKRGAIEPLNLIIGVMLILGGAVYIFNGKWGLFITSIGLLMEAVKQVIK